MFRAGPRTARSMLRAGRWLRRLPGLLNSRCRHGSTGQAASRCNFMVQCRRRASNLCCDARLDVTNTRATSAVLINGSGQPTRTVPPSPPPSLPPRYVEVFTATKADFLQAQQQIRLGPVLAGGRRRYLPQHLQLAGQAGLAAGAAAAAAAGSRYPGMPFSNTGQVEEVTDQFFRGGCHGCRCCGCPCWLLVMLLLAHAAAQGHGWGSTYAAASRACCHAAVLHTTSHGRWPHMCPACAPLQDSTSTRDPPDPAHLARRRAAQQANCPTCSTLQSPRSSSPGSSRCAQGDSTAQAACCSSWLSCGVASHVGRAQQLERCCCCHVRHVACLACLQDIMWMIWCSHVLPPPTCHTAA
jgi:hypothetical protein